MGSRAAPSGTPGDAPGSACPWSVGPTDQQHPHPRSSLEMQAQVPPGAPSQKQRFAGPR